MSMPIHTTDCVSNFRELSLPRKLFLGLILAQFTIFLFVIFSYTSGLRVRNDVYSAQSTSRYLMQRTPRTNVYHVDKTSISQSTNPRRSSKPTPTRDEHADYVKRQMKRNVTKPKCPLVPPYLKGRVEVDVTEYDEKALERKHRWVRKGGIYKPLTCRSRHKVSIIIPYRNRKRHLRILVNNLHPFLQRQQLDYRIFVIELAPNVDFNRALCMNIGFLEAKGYGYQCFIFHDVDLIPENDNNMYSCLENPRHMSVAIDKFEYQLPYVGLFGGVTAMTKDQFEMVNGYSNKFFGWGGEDDDLYIRIRNLGVSITRYTPDVSSYRMLRHQADSTPNKDRLHLLQGSLDRWKEDGINTIKYEVLQTVEKRMYTYILAAIDQEDWAYRPFNIANGNWSRDDSFDPEAEELFLDKAKYLLGKFSLDNDLVNRLKKEFHRLNTSDVSMNDISGIIQRMFPVKSPGPMDLPELKQSAGNGNKTNNQAGMSDISLYSLLHDRAKNQSQELNVDMQMQEKQYSVEQPIPQPHEKRIMEHIEIQEQSKPVQSLHKQQEIQNSVHQEYTKQEYQTPIKQVHTKQENQNNVQKAQAQFNRNHTRLDAQQNPMSLQQTEKGNQTPGNTNINTALTDNQTGYQQRLKTYGKYRQRMQSLQAVEEVKPRQNPLNVFQKLIHEVHQPFSAPHKNEFVKLNNKHTGEIQNNR